MDRGRSRPGWVGSRSARGRVAGGTALVGTRAAPGERADVPARRRRGARREGRARPGAAGGGGVEGLGLAAELVDARHRDAEDRGRLYDRVAAPRRVTGRQPSRAVDPFLAERGRECRPAPLEARTGVRTRGYGRTLARACHNPRKEPFPARATSRTERGGEPHSALPPCSKKWEPQFARRAFHGGAGAFSPAGQSPSEAVGLRRSSSPPFGRIDRANQGAPHPFAERQPGLVGHPVHPLFQRRRHPHGELDGVIFTLRFRHGAERTASR